MLFRPTVVAGANQINDLGVALAKRVDNNPFLKYTLIGASYAADGFVLYASGGTALAAQKLTGKLQDYATQKASEALAGGLKGAGYQDGTSVGGAGGTVLAVSMLGALTGNVRGLLDSVRALPNRLAGLRQRVKSGPPSAPEIVEVPKALPAPKLTAEGRRNTPGVASHGGALPYIRPGQTWLKGSTPIAGKVPAQVAEKLAGKEFKTFGDFKVAFWKAVAADPVLSKQFRNDDLRAMRRFGNAPSVQDASQHLGKRTVYEIDHVLEIQHGGSVYDMNNLIVRTPYNHVKGK